MSAAAPLMFCCILIAPTQIINGFLILPGDLSRDLRCYLLPTSRDWFRARLWSLCETGRGASGLSELSHAFKNNTAPLPFQILQLFYVVSNTLPHIHHHFPTDLWIPGCQQRGVFVISFETSWFHLAYHVFFFSALFVTERETDRGVFPEENAGVPQPRPECQPAAY